MRILFAEDDPVCRRVLTAILDAYGPCDPVADGVQAVAAFEKALAGRTPYDLICLDIIMPGMDGLEALKRIRQIETQNGIVLGQGAKIIILSVLGDCRTVLDVFFQGGATAYMVKPIDGDKLRVELNNMGFCTNVESPWSRNVEVV